MILKIILWIVVIGNISLALFVTVPPITEYAYGVTQFDNFHILLAALLTGGIVPLTVGAYMAARNPIRHKNIILLLIILHYAVFAGEALMLLLDVATLPLNIGMQALYDIVIAVGLTLFYPREN